MTIEEMQRKLEGLRSQIEELNQVIDRAEIVPADVQAAITRKWSEYKGLEADIEAEQKRLVRLESTSG